jgi:polyphosphate kinase
MAHLLTPPQRRYLQRLARVDDGEPRRRAAEVLLYYADGLGTRAIAERMGVTARSVRRWRHRFEEEGLKLFEGLTAVGAVSRSDEEQAAEPVPTPPEAGFDLDDPALYLNRELSLVEFQRRVLQEAQDERNPLLERVKFLAIVGSNMDELFMVRIGGLKMQEAAGVGERSADGRTPSETLAAVRAASGALMQDARRVWHETLRPALRKEGIFVLDYGDLTPEQREAVRQHFRDFIFPVLTPMAFGPSHPFPHISNLSLNLAVRILDRSGREQLARLKVPNSISRLLALDPLLKTDDGTHSFVWLEDVIAANLDLLFPGMDVQEAQFFRVTRSAETAIQELEADDLLVTMEQHVRERRFGEVVRLAVDGVMPEAVRSVLVENLDMDDADVYALDAPLGFSDLMSLYGKLPQSELKDRDYVPAALPIFTKREGSLFSVIRQQDVILHRPYDSFGPVIEFLDAAADDPKVLAIKQTLYRVGSNAPVVKALLRARENGKQVTALVELKARFDEESNIGWAKRLEREGVHVVYGLLGLKTHSKIALVVRKEGDRIRRYLHLATGNYNASTARLYEDLDYFTADDAMGADATDLFNYLTGYSGQTSYRKLLIAPINLRQRLEGLVRREMQHASEGRDAHLIFKTNSLVDVQMIRLLYEASQAGVRIDLIVRGMCMLRPGVPGLSETITVTSVVGRFLEHSRVYYCLCGGEEEMYIGSADLMRRNLDRRVEIVFPVENPRHLRYLRDDVLQTYLDDTVKARKLGPDGIYTYAKPEAGEEPVYSQERFMRA